MNTNNTSSEGQSEASDRFRVIDEDIHNLKEDIKNSYYRIPKQDFETVTIAKITKEVADKTNEKLNSWRNWMGAILAVVSLFGYKQFTDLSDYYSKEVKEFRNELKDFKQQANNDISANFKQQNSTIETLFNSTASKLKDKLYDDKERLVVDINKELGPLTQKETERQISGIVEDMNSTKKIALQVELDLLSKDVDAGKNFALAINKAENIIKRAIPIDGEEIVEKCLNKICLWTFSSYEWRKMDDLYSRYEKNYKFSAESWANFGIADMFLFAQTNSKIYRTRALEALDKSLEELPDYGTPQAVRLIIHMTDYDRDNSVNDKANEKKEALNLINTINKSTDSPIAYETIKYLQTVEDVCNVIIDDPNNENTETYSKMLDNINNLYAFFPSEMDTMKEKFEKELKSKKRLSEATQF